MMKPTKLTGRCAVPTAFSFAALLAATVAFTEIPVNAATQTSPVPASAASSPRESPTQLETLVSRIALYPDDLVALVIPAATYPLQVVEAARWLEKRKKDSKLAVPESWDDSVKSLANYPEVIKLMNDDLQWTQALNDAVVSDQAGVLNAVQSYRRKVIAAGNLKSDDKQVVTVEREVVTIVQANPQIIYVPQYEPSAMVVYGGYSSWGYYGMGYPSYYYPYAPGAALATGLIWGAAIGAAWGGGRYGYNGGNNNININNNVNVGSGNRGDRTNVGGGNRGQGAGGGTSWKPSSKASTSGGGRIGDGDGAGGRGPSASTGAVNRGGGASGAGGRGASAGTYGPPSGSSRGASSSMGASSRGGGSSYGGGSYGGGSSYGGSRGGSAFSSGGYSSRSSASSFSSRGASSRGFSGGGGRRR